MFWLQLVPAAVVHCKHLFIPNIQIKVQCLSSLSTLQSFKHKVNCQSNSQIQ